METGTLILILSFLVPFIVIGLIFYSILRRNKRDASLAKVMKERQATAVPVNAKIISARQGAGGGSIRAIVHLRLEVLDSHSPYTAGCTWFVESLYFSQLQPGSIISVKVDTEDKNIIYPDVQWAVHTVGYDKLKGLTE